MKDNILIVYSSNCLIFILILVNLLLIPCSTLFAKLVIYSFNDIVSKSDAIIEGHVIDVKRKLFSKDLSLIRIVSIIDGDIASLQVSIRFGRANIFHASEDTTNLVVGK